MERLLDYNWKNKSHGIINSISSLVNTLVLCYWNFLLSIVRVMENLQSPSFFSFPLIEVLPNKNCMVHFSYVALCFPMKNSVRANILVLFFGFYSLLSCTLYNCMSVCLPCLFVSPSRFYYFIQKELDLIVASSAYILFITLPAGTCLQLINLSILLPIWIA